VLEALDGLLTCLCTLIVNTSQNELSKVEKSELVIFSADGLLAKSMVALRSFLGLKYVFEKLLELKGHNIGELL
jgi:hypothetical protein